LQTEPGTFAVNRQNAAVLGKAAHLYFNVNKYDPDTTWADVLLRKVGNTIREIVTTDFKTMLPFLTGEASSFV
jgi:hypothetical protein